MAQPQQNIALRAPGFMGINTQDSPIEQDVSYASVADNCIIDKNGRIAVRKGIQQLTTNPDVLEGNPIKATQEFTAEDGIKIQFACGNNKIFIQETIGTLELVEQVLPTVPTDDNWEIIPFNNQCFFVQQGHAPLVYTYETGLFTEVVPTGDATTWFYGFPNCATAAFGRMWYGDFDNNKSVVFWSDLLDGDTVVGTGNSIDLSEVWPSGFDELTAVRAWNNFLIYFGKRSIVVYNVDPAGPAATGTRLADTVEGIGCIARDSVIPLGDQLWFLDSTGVRDFARTIQEKSLPIGDISYNVRSDFKQAITYENKNDVKAVYHPEDSLYAIFLPNNPKTYVFDTRVLGQRGEARATQWTDIRPRCSGRSTTRNTYMGGVGGIYEYRGFEDVRKVTDADPFDEVEITCQYITHPMTFGDPSTLKFPKQVDVTIIGGQQTQLCLDWAYDYTELFKTSCKLVKGSGVPGYYDLNEPPIPDVNALSQYNLNAEYGPSPGVQRLKYNIWGSGNNVKIGFRVSVKDAPFSFQEINIQALLGRIL